MSLQSHMDQLKKRHRDLDDCIFDKEQQPSANHLAIVSLKREKLKLKDQIERLSRTLH